MFPVFNAAVGGAEMAVGGVVARFWLFGFFMIAVRLRRSEICKFQFL